MLNFHVFSERIHVYSENVVLNQIFKMAFSLVISYLLMQVFIFFQVINKCNTFYRRYINLLIEFNYYNFMFYIQTEERDEDQRILNLVGEALRLLGNALVALSDLRCNLLSTPPRHLHVIRPMSHYTSSVLNPAGMHHIPMQVRMWSKGLMQRKILKVKA